MTEHIKEILIVDDEENFLEVTADCLGVLKNYFNIRISINGKEAVEILKSSHIDFVITDLGMPEMDGFELVAYMNRNYPWIPVIFMTCYGTPKIEEIMRNMGVFGYMEKPLDHPLCRLGIGRNYRPAALAAFVEELVRSITYSLNIKTLDTDLKKVKENILRDTVIRGHKPPAVIDIKTLLSLKNMEISAKQGNAEAQFDIGWYYFAGEIVAKNLREAAKWFLQAVLQGEIRAKLFFGHMLFWGDGVEQNKQEGLRLITKAATEQYSEAQFYLGWLYKAGDGLEMNKSEALKWFKRAAALGHKSADSNIKALQE